MIRDVTPGRIWVVPHPAIRFLLDFYHGNQWSHPREPPWGVFGVLREPFPSLKGAASQNFLCRSFKLEPKITKQRAKLRSSVSGTQDFSVEFGRTKPSNMKIFAPERMVGRLPSFGDGNFLKAMLNFKGVREHLYIQYINK